MTYAEHITRICKIEDIEVVSHSSCGRAWRKKRRIAIRQVKTAITYAVALHEIGHILGPRQTGKNTRLDKEVGAWEWAQQSAIEWTDVMDKQRSKSLRSYLAWSERSKQAKRLTNDHPIHALIRT